MVDELFKEWEAADTVGYVADTTAPTDDAVGQAQLIGGGLDTILLASDEEEQGQGNIADPFSDAYQPLLHFGRAYDHIPGDTLVADIDQTLTRVLERIDAEASIEPAIYALNEMRTCYTNRQ